MYVSSLLEEGNIYTRKNLAKILNYPEPSLNVGVFIPRKYHSILLFVTEIKTPDKTQYYDHLKGDILEWDGQKKGMTDDKIINHNVNGMEILLFYRKDKKSYPNYGFMFEGKFMYISHKILVPTRFILNKVND